MRPRAGPSATASMSPRAGNISGERLAGRLPVSRLRSIPWRAI
jgi:hypothetical protein